MSRRDFYLICLIALAFVVLQIAFNVLMQMIEGGAQ